jgi:hypothetical protein
MAKKLSDFTSKPKKKSEEDTIPTSSANAMNAPGSFALDNPTNTSMSLNGGDQRPSLYYKGKNGDASDLAGNSRRQKLQKLRIDEARGRKGKASVETDADSGDDNLIYQMRKAINLRGRHNVKFADGSTMQVHPSHAHKIISQFTSIRRPIDKQDYINKVGASAKTFTKHLQDDVQGIDRATDPVYNPRSNWGDTVKSSALATEDFNEAFKKMTGKDKIRAFLKNPNDPKTSEAVRKQYPAPISKTELKKALKVEAIGPRDAVVTQPPYSMAMIPTNPLRPDATPTSHAIPTSSMDVESTKDDKRQQIADRLKQMIMQIIMKKEEVIDPIERERLRVLHTKRREDLANQREKKLAAARTAIMGAHKRQRSAERTAHIRRLQMYEYFNDLFGSLIAEAGFPARGKQDSDVEGDRMGVSVEPPAKMNAKKEKKIIAGGKGKDEIVMNPPLRVDEAKAKLHKPKKPHVKSQETPEFPQLSKIIKEKVAQSTGDLKDACWKGYTAVGFKNKDGRRVPNCVPNEAVESVDNSELTEEYPMTYVKVNSKGAGDQNPSASYVHSRVSFGNEKPTTPERVKHLVKNSPKHKDMISKGYKVHSYGSHTGGSTHFGMPAKVTTESATMTKSGAGEMGTSELTKTYARETPGQNEDIKFAHHSASVPWEVKEGDSGKSEKLYQKIREVLSGKSKR